MKDLIIQGTIYPFPEQSDTPTWGKEASDWAEAVTNAVAGLAGSYDVNNIAFSVDNATASFQDISNVSFDPTAVKGIKLDYAVRRTSSSSNLLQIGTILASYDSTAPASSQWSFSHSYQGNASVDFNITDLGQVQIKATSLLAGTGYVGNLRINGRAFEV